MRTRWIVAAVLVVVGTVWIGQGLGILRGSSFMTGDPLWAVLGLGLVAVGLVVGWAALRARPRS